MSKLILLQGPIQTRSGYGDHCSDIARAIIKKYPDWELKILPTVWGGCPISEFTDNSEESILIRSKFMTENLVRQPDVYIQITVPNEFRRMGKYCIGITAGIETTIADSTWIEGCNRMDLIIVPSKHSKDVFMNTIFDQINQQKQRVGELKINKPIEVLFEGIDDKVFKFTDEITPSVEEEMSVVEEKFAFLYVGHWLQGEHGHDRKDVAGLIKSFYESFANKTNCPALVLKTSTAGFSVMEQDTIIRKIQDIRALVVKEQKTEKLPNVYLLHGDLTRTDMNSLYNHPKIKAMVSFTKGEGFGRPLLEFTASKKPVLVSGWSGQLDFLDNQTSVLLPGELKQVHQSAVWEHIIIPESSWFYVDYEFAKSKIRDVFAKYNSYQTKANKQYLTTMNNFTLDKMADKMEEIFNKYLQSIPDTLPLNMPQLPKLKKV